MRGKREGILVLLIIVLVFISLNFASAWKLNGTIYDANGIILNGTNISASAMFAPGGSPPTYPFINSTMNNWSTASFELNVTDNSSCNYQIILRHINVSNNATDYVGQVLPFFPYSQLSTNITTNFYLKQAGTINITAINSSGSRILFNYQVKDTTLGFTIAQLFNSSGALEANVYVPVDRNYSIMIFPVGSMPLSYTWNNFSSSVDYTFSDIISKYNASRRIVHKQFNTTTNLARFAGYINGSALGITGWNSFTIIPYLLQGGNMIFMSDSGYGSMPYNMSAWNSQSDLYNYSTGYYNITIPGTAETQTILFFVSALNGSTYYGAYKNITTSYTQSQTNYNITMYGLLGSLSSTLGIQSSTGAGYYNISTMKQQFFLVNASNTAQALTMSLETHGEISTDYSGAGCGGVVAFTIMATAASGANNLSAPLLNCTGIKEINIFSQSFSPRRIGTKTVAQINANPNISLNNFDPRPIDNSASGANIDMAMFVSNSSCDIPNPGTGCLVGGSEMNMANFNPLSAIIGGGKISFRMGYGGIKVHYVNVDMLASGPPDAVFDSSLNATASSTSFAGLTRFGSKGPTMYSYVLVSMPYSEEGSNSLKDNLPVNISIPYFYDENWNVTWDISANGTNPEALAGNDTHYSTYKNAWGNLTKSQTCTKGTGNLFNSVLINETNPCYIDTVKNRIWIRLPHFSGTGPQAVGITSTTRYSAINVTSFLFPTSNDTYLNVNSLTINATTNITDFNNLTIYLYNNATGPLSTINTTNSSTDPSVSITFSGLMDGLWFFNATAFNSTSNANSSTELRNVTIDTIYPLINNASLTSVNNSVVGRSIFVNMSASDINIRNVTIRVYNSSLDLYNSTVNSSINYSVIGNWSVNYTWLPDIDGLYYFDGISCDRANNCNATTKKQVKLNITSVAMNASHSATTESTAATIRFYSNKTVNATINYGTSSSLGTAGTDITSFSVSGSFSLTGLTASTTYYYNITICDRAGNCIVNGTNSFATSVASSSTTSSSSSGATADWYLTYYPLDSDFEKNEGYNKELVAKYRVKVKLGTEDHYVGLLSLTGTTATIQVSSTPQQAVFNIGDEKKFEITGDNYYDIYVKLNGIANNKANVTIKKINELISSAQTTTGQEAESATETQQEISKEKSKWWLWLIIIIIILGVAGYLGYRKRLFG